MSLSSLGTSELSAVASVLQQPADNFGNDATVEMMWAIKAYEHAETYFNILLSVDTTLLRICRIDDEIYRAFRAEFPDTRVDVVDELEMKSADGKQKWRELCNKFEGQVDDWNLATLLRLDSRLDVSEDNTTLVPRIQFLAVEIARNREGCNRDVRHTYRSACTDQEQQNGR